MQTQEILGRLDALIHSRSILLHSFYVAWNAGELTHEQLETYAKVYYPHVVSFPKHLKTAASGADDPTVQKELEQNLGDEISRPKPHNELWLDFAEGLGLDRNAVATATAHPAARNIVDTFTRLTGDNTVSALAALYAYESQQPEVSRRKADGLRRYYGIDESATLAYFEVHAETDIRHRNGEREALSRCVSAGAPDDLILDSANEALTAYWELLDGVCDESGIPLTC